MDTLRFLRISTTATRAVTLSLPLAGTLLTAAFSVQAAPLLADDSALNPYEYRREQVRAERVAAPLPAPMQEVVAGEMLPVSVKTNSKPQMRVRIPNPDAVEQVSSAADVASVTVLDRQLSEADGDDAQEPVQLAETLPAPHAQKSTGNAGSLTAVKAKSSKSNSDLAPGTLSTTDDSLVKSPAVVGASVDTTASTSAARKFFNTLATPFSASLSAVDSIVDSTHHVVNSVAVQWHEAELRPAPAVVVQTVEDNAEPRIQLPSTNLAAAPAPTSPAPAATPTAPTPIIATQEQNATLVQTGAALPNKSQAIPPARTAQTQAPTPAPAAAAQNRPQPQTTTAQLPAVTVGGDSAATIFGGDSQPVPLYAQQPPQPQPYYVQQQPYYPQPQYAPPQQYAMPYPMYPPQYVQMAPQYYAQPMYAPQQPMVYAQAMPQPMMMQAPQAQQVIDYGALSPASGTPATAVPATTPTQQNTATPTTPAAVVATPQQPVVMPVAAPLPTTPPRKSVFEASVTTSGGTPTATGSTSAAAVDAAAASAAIAAKGANTTPLMAEGSSEPTPTLAPGTRKTLAKIPGGLDSPKKEETTHVSIERETKKEEKKPAMPATKKPGEKTDAVAEATPKEAPYGIKIDMRKPSFDAQYELERAYNALTAGDTESAVRFYSAVMENDANNKQALFGLAATYHRIGQLEKARPLYSRLLKLEPTHREALNNFLALAADEAPKEALSELEALEKRNPDFNAIPAQMAYVYEKLNMPDEAIAKMVRATDLAPENLTYRYNLAVMYDKAGRGLEAAAIYKQIVDASYRGEPVPGDVSRIQQRLSFLSSNKP